MRVQHGRDSAELRSLCQARDDARKERDQLKADNEALRKDVEQALQASLEAIVIELPHEVTHVTCIPYEEGRDDVIAAIHAAGVKTK